MLIHFLQNLDFLSGFDMALVQVIIYGFHNGELFLVYFTPRWKLFFCHRQSRWLTLVNQEKPSLVVVDKRGFLHGGPEETRTLDLSDANRTLSQLSYRPDYF